MIEAEFISFHDRHMPQPQELFHKEISAMMNRASTYRHKIEKRAANKTNAEPSTSRASSIPTRAPGAMSSVERSTTPSYAHGPCS